jgi:hypothetical protein
MIDYIFDKKLETTPSWEAAAFQGECVAKVM